VWRREYLCEVELSAGLDAEEVGAGFGLVGGEGAQDLHLLSAHEAHAD
jgi:hypothetical protein